MYSPTFSTVIAIVSQISGTIIIKIIPMTQLFTSLLAVPRFMPRLAFSNPSITSEPTKIRFCVIYVW